MQSARKKSTAARRGVTRRETGANLTDVVYDAVHGAIQAGTLKPGERVREIEVSAWLKVSRTPVREALRRLRSEGIIEPKAGGLAVTSFDMRAVAELYDVRQTLEGAAAALAAVNADPTELALLQRTLDAQRQCLADPNAQARINKSFHAQVYQAAHNRFLLKALQVLRDSLVLLGPTTLMTPARIKAALSEHAEVVAAIVARDPKRAEEVTRKHIRSGYQERVRAMADHLQASTSRDV
jgi:DNA-binding GntR family transcriptional regulator